MAGPAVSALPLYAGSSLPPRFTPVAVRLQKRPPLLKVAGPPPPPRALRRSVPASVQRCAAASGHGRQEPRTSGYQFDDDEPLWLAVVREIAAGLRGLISFLAEQPKQLKHLEWPGFQNTVTTIGTRNMNLQWCLSLQYTWAMFIVALSSVDAALCYILSWLLRKSA